MATLMERLQNPDYKAWIKTSICLGFTKVGLEVFAAENSKTFHKNVLDQLRIKGNPNSSQVCSQATVRSGRATCCSNCQDYIDEIDRQNMKYFLFRQGNWDNSNMQLWPNDPWEMAKVFMNPGQKPTQRSPGDTDLSGILNFVDHCVVAKNKITHKGNISKVRDSRNSVMHSASMTLDQKDFTDFATYMIDLLEDPGDLSKSLKAQEAARKVREVMTKDFHITIEDENRILAEKMEHLENEIMRLKTKHTEIQKEIKEIKENTEILKGFEIKTNDNISDLKASVEELHRRENVVRCCIAELYKRIENAADMEQMQNSLTKLESVISLIHGMFTNLECQIRQLGDVFMSGLQDLECKILEKKSSEDFTKDTRKLQRSLIDEYKRLGFDIPLSPVNEDINDERWKIKVDEIYVDLTIVESEKSFPFKTYKDIFYSEEKRNRIIFLKGEAGVGKSTWCMKLLFAWVRTQDKAEKSSDKHTNISSESTQQDLEEILLQFEFLFYIPLRYLKDKTSVREAVFSSTLQGLSDFKSTFQMVIEGCSDKVLLLLDGLDEYSVNLSYEGLNRCTVITTTRPWKYDLFLTKNPGFKVDLVLKLEGLDKNGIKTLAQRLCAAWNNSIYDEKSSICWNGATRTFSMGVQDQVEQFFERVRNVDLENCLKVPLTLVIMLETFLEKHFLADTKTDILISLLETLVERGERKLSDLESIQSNENTLGPFIETNVLSPYSDLLRKLSKLAFESIVSSEKEHSLIFSENQVNQYFDGGELNVCLKFGLISKSRHLILCRKPKISFSFYHKLIQEFFAAVWIVSNKEAVDTMKSIITCIRDVMEIDNVFVFICGLNAYIGSEMTKHFISLCNTDEEIVRLRSWPLSVSGGIAREHPKALLHNLTMMLMKGQEEIKVSGPNVSLFGSDIVIFRLATSSENALLKILTESVDCLKSLNIPLGYISGATYHKIFEIVQTAVGLQNFCLINGGLSMIKGGFYIGLNLRNCKELQVINIRELRTPEIQIGNLQNLRSIFLDWVHMPSAKWELFFDQLKTLSQLCSLRLISCCCDERDLNLETCIHLSLKRIGSVERDLNLENCIQLKTLFIAKLDASAIRIGERTNLTEVDLSDVKMSSSGSKLLFEQLGKQSNLRELSLKGIGSVERDLNLENCIQLKTLFIAELDAPAIRIGERTNLTKVDLSDVKMSSSCWKLLFDQLGKQSNLERLSLKRIGSVERDLNLENCIQLENLLIAVLDAPAIRIGERTNLTEVDLSDVKMSSSGSKLLFDQLGKQSNLRELSLKGIGSVERDLNLENCIQLENLLIDELDAPAIRIGERTNLTEVDLSDVKMSSSGSKLLFDQLGKQSNLERLSLKGIGSVERDLNLENCIQLENLLIDELDAPAIRIGERTNLTEVDLSDVKMSSSCWKLLFDQLGKQSNLERLSLKPIGSVERDLNLENCIQLENLLIAVLDAPAIRIGERTNLTEVDLSDVKMSSSGSKLLFDQLGKQSNLRELSLKGIGSVERDLNLENCIQLKTLFIAELDAPAIRIGERTNLTKVDLSDVKMSSSCWKLLFDQLEKQSNLNKLSLKRIGSVERDLNLENCIHFRTLFIAELDASAIRIGERRNLTKVDLSDVKMSSSGWKLLFDQLGKQSILRELSLKGIGSVERDLNLENCIRLKTLFIAELDAPAIRIGERTNLTEVDLSDVKMSSSGSKLLFDQLGKQSNLRELSLKRIGSVERDLNLENCIQLENLLIDVLDAPAIRIGERTNLTEVDLSDVKMSSSGSKLLFDQLGKQSNLRELSLKGIGSVERDLNLENCIQLKTLFIAELDAPAIRIGERTNLTEVDLSDVKMSSSGSKLLFDQLGKQSNLERLSLKRIGSVERDLNLENCIQLKTLFIAELDASAIRIGERTNLTEVDLSDVKMSSSGWKLLFDQLGKQSNLERLSLKGIGSVERDLNLENCIQLENLLIDELDAPAIRIGERTNLTEVDLSDVKMSSSGSKLLFDQLGKQSNLERLSLKGIGSVERDLNLENCIQLENLLIDELDAPAIRIGERTNLTEVDLSDVKMSSSGSKLLFDQLGKQSNLERLSLKGIGSVERDLNLENCIQLENLLIDELDAPAIRIGERTNLTEVDLSDVKMSSSDSKLLFEQLGKQSNLRELSLKRIGSVERDLNLENCIQLKTLFIAELDAPAIRIGERTNLTKVDLSDVKMSSSCWKLLFDQLGKQSNLERLSLKGIGSVERDLNLENCIQLENLLIDVLDAPAIRIGERTNLTEVDLSDVKMSSSGWKLLFDQLGKQSNLERLSLKRIGSVERDLNLENCIHLENLLIDLLDAPAIRIGEWSNLTNVDLSDVKMSSSGSKLLFDQLEKQSNLRRLSLKGIGSVERDLNLENCIQLGTVSIAGFEVPAIRIDELEALKEIKIVDVQMSSSGLKLLFDQLEKRCYFSRLILENIGSVERDLNLENCIDFDYLSIKGLNAPAIRIGDLDHHAKITIHDVKMTSLGLKLLIDKREELRYLCDVEFEGIGILE